MAFVGPIAAANTDALYTDLVAFCVANAGYTDEGKVTMSGQMEMYTMSKNGIYYWFHRDEYIQSGFGTAGHLTSRMMLVQPTESNRLALNDGMRDYLRVTQYANVNGPYTGYYFFTDGTAVHVAIESVPNVFITFSFGEITKSWNWTGGSYLTGSRGDYYVGGNWSWITSPGSICFSGGAFDNSYTGAVYYPVNAYGDYRDFARIRNNVQDGQRARMVSINYIPNNDASLASYSFPGIMLKCSPNLYNNRASIVPPYLLLWNPSLSSYYLAGHVSGAGFIMIDNIAPKEIVDVDWQCFPMICKFGDTTANAVTGNVGLAFRRIV